MKGGEGNSNKGESHRIYWQQWPSSAASSGAKSRRELITSSAAIRISPDGARANDVTNLLCETLNLDNNNNSQLPPQDNWDQVQDAWNQDCLVLIGTLYSLPLHYVRFQHEVEEQQRRLQQQQQQQLQQSGLDTLADETNSSVHSGSSGSSRVATMSCARSDPPFHVVKTLSPSDNPLQVRDKMIQHLECLLLEACVLSAGSSGNNVKKSNIAPKLQWYFVPGINHPSSPIPSYIDLDGYSTSIEESDDEEDEDDENDMTCSDSDSEFEEYFGSTQLTKSHSQAADDDGCGKQELDGANKSLYPWVSTPLPERALDKQRQRYYELSISQSALHHHCISGYLLKQSMKDPHVWKRVYCVLTDDQLWYVSRIDSYPSGIPRDSPDEVIHDILADEEKKDQQSSGQPQEPPIYRRPQHSLPSSSSIGPAPTIISYAKHRQLGLTRALLIEPSQDRPLARTPFAFEVISSNGIPHRFRATNQPMYARWVEALKGRIVQAYENSLMDHAGLIVKDETEARNKRYFQVAVEPLWNSMTQNGEDLATANGARRACHVNMMHGSDKHDEIMQVVRFGMKIAEYRERCRHISAVLPAKQAVMAVTSDGLKLRINHDVDKEGGETEEDDCDESELARDLQGHSIRLDGASQLLIQMVWEEAVRLGSSATKLAMELQAPLSTTTEKGNSRPTSMNMPRSLDTICRHLEFVMTGSFRKASDSPGQQQRRLIDSTRQFPPPMDLFDAFLAELQAVAGASASLPKKPLFLATTSTDAPKGDEDGETQNMNGGNVH